MYAKLLLAVALAAAAVSAAPAEQGAAAGPGRPKGPPKGPKTWDWAKKNCARSTKLRCCRQDGSGGGEGDTFDVNVTCTKIATAALGAPNAPREWCPNAVCCDVTQDGNSSFQCQD